MHNFYLFDSLQFVLIDMVVILMMPAKLAPLGLLKSLIVS